MNKMNANNHQLIRNFIDAWLDGDKGRMDEIQEKERHETERQAQIRRNSFFVVPRT